MLCSVVQDKKMFDCHCLVRSERYRERSANNKTYVIKLMKLSIISCCRFRGYESLLKESRELSSLYAGEINNNCQQYI